MVEQSPPGVHELLQAEVSFSVVVEPEAENLPPPRADSRVAIFSRIQPNIFSRIKHSELGFPCLSQDAIFNDCAHTVIVQQRLSPCKVFKGEFVKFCQYNGRVGCFSHPE
jgi:hypothetical protein